MTQPLHTDVGQRLVILQLSSFSRNWLDNGTPTLLVLEQLKRAGWDRGPSPALHDASTPRLFGEDKFANKKHYLQCLLSLGQLGQKGLIALPSGQSSWYYRAVLASEHPAGVAPGALARDYKALLFGHGQERVTADDGGEGPRLAICDASASDADSGAEDAVMSIVRAGDLANEEPPVNEAAGQFPQALLDADQSVEPGQAVAGQSPVDRPDAPSPRASSSSSGSGADSADGDGEVVALRSDGQFAANYNARRPVNECIRVEEHLQPGMPGHYRRYTTICPLASSGHCAVVACGKRRNCGAAQMGSLGRAAPEAFLMVWREKASSFGSKADHQRWSPTWSEVRRYMVAQGWPVGQ